MGVKYEEFPVGGKCVERERNVREKSQLQHRHYFSEVRLHPNCGIGLLPGIRCERAWWHVFSLMDSTACLHSIGIDPFAFWLSNFYSTRCLCSRL